MKLPILKITKSEWISFVLTLIATLIGVLIAIWLSNSQVKKKEKADSIKLLQTARLIMQDTYRYTNALHNTILEMEQDTSVNRIENVKSNNPIPYPHLVETIISNDLVSKNISEYSHSAIYINLINAKKIANYDMVACYKNHLEKMILLVSLEIDYLNGKIGSQELESDYESGEVKIEDGSCSDESILKIEID